MILLIHSGSTDRYWAHIPEISRDLPDLELILSYYRNDVSKIKTWFKVIRFEKASKDVMFKCIVTSSNNLLSNASKYSMSPYFKTEYKK